MDKNFATTYNWLIAALELQGNYSEAFEWLMKAQTLQKSDDETIQLFKTAYQTSGWQGVLREQARKFDESNTHYFFGGCLNAKIGNKDANGE
ncbi:MAG: hypothetical protein M3371_09445 [Acidobacteriota bacterium]|nr:hypothetical protein [Acidobacteriota bacterium]